MGSFDKKYIVKEAESIIIECNKKFQVKNDKSQIVDLKVMNKKLKRKNIFWRVCTAIAMGLFIISMI